MKYLLLGLCLCVSVANSRAKSKDFVFEAEQLYQQAMDKNQAGLLVEASVLFTQAIALDNQQPHYFHHRGLSFFGMGELNQGIKDFNQAVNLKTTELSVYLKLISHYMKNSQYMAVLIITDQLAANLPNQAAGAYYDKGRAYEAMHNFTMAKAAYQASLNQLGNDQADFRKLLENKIQEIEQQERE